MLFNPADAPMVNLLVVLFFILMLCYGIVAGIESGFFHRIGREILGWYRIIRFRIRKFFE